MTDIMWIALTFGIWNMAQMKLSIKQRQTCRPGEQRWRCQKGEAGRKGMDQEFGAARAALSLWCSSTSLYWFLLLRSPGSRAHELQWVQFLGSTVVVPRLSFSVACGICLDQGSNLGLLHCRRILYLWATREAPVFLSYFAGCLV